MSYLLQAEDLIPQSDNGGVYQHGLSLELTSKRIVCLVGPNGSGKTAYLRALAGVDPATGTLRLLDEMGIRGELKLRDYRTGRVETTQMWGRPESVRQEFRRLRSQ